MINYRLIIEALIVYKEQTEKDLKDFMDSCRGRCDEDEVLLNIEKTYKARIKMIDNEINKIENS